MKKSSIELFLHNGPYLILLHSSNLIKTGDKYSHALSKILDSNYSYTIQVLKKFEKIGLLFFEKKGRTKIIKLTPKGETLLKQLKRVNDILL